MRGFFRKWGAVALALVLSLSVFAGMDGSSVQAAEDHAEDWMADIDGETMLSSISIPGTHDSATQYVGMRYIFQCQDTSIAQQLVDGYRYFDMRLVLDGKEDEQTLILKHNFAKCKEGGGLFAKALKLSNVLSDVYAFLQEHPSETVILCMKAENSKDDVAQVQKLLYEQIDQNPQMWHLANEIPTLEQVRGKIVLATRFEDAMELGQQKSGLHFYWEDQGDREIVDVPYALSAISDSASLWVQDRYNYDTSDKLDAIVDDLENCQAADDTFSINFTSTSGSGKVGHPKKYATTINDYLLSYDWQAGTSYGIVVVDFATKDLAKCIYETNTFVK